MPQTPTLHNQLIAQPNHNHNHRTIFGHNPYCAYELSALPMMRLCARTFISLLRPY